MRRPPPCILRAARPPPSSPHTLCGEGQPTFRLLPLLSPIRASQQPEPKPHLPPIGSRQESGRVGGLKRLLEEHGLDLWEGLALNEREAGLEGVVARDGPVRRADDDPTRGAAGGEVGQVSTKP